MTKTTTEEHLCSRLEWASSESKVLIGTEIISHLGRAWLHFEFFGWQRFFIVIHVVLLVKRTDRQAALGHTTRGGRYWDPAWTLRCR